MAEKVILSPKYTLQVRDFLKGALVAVLASVLPVVQDLIASGELVFDWKAILKVALSAFIAYIAKNFFEPNQVTTTYDSKSKAVAVAKDIEQKNNA